MRILSQTNDIKGYHGTIGTLTNMYDYRGNHLFVGDVVCLVTFGVDGKKAYDFGIEFVCEENTSIANWTGKNRQFVMGIASIYNNEKFKVLDEVELNTQEWAEKFNMIDSNFRVYKVKDHSQLAIAEKIGFLSVVDISDHQPRKAVRYGYWIEDKDTGSLICSECGHVTVEIIGDMIEQDGKIIHRSMNPFYCSKCGADMQVREEKK